MIVIIVRKNIKARDQLRAATEAERDLLILGASEKHGHAVLDALLEEVLQICKYAKVKKSARRSKLKLETLCASLKPVPRYSMLSAGQQSLITCAQRVLNGATQSKTPLFCDAPRTFG